MSPSPCPADRTVTCPSLEDKSNTPSTTLHREAHCLSIQRGSPSTRPNFEEEGVGVDWRRPLTPIDRPLHSCQVFNLRNKPQRALATSFLPSLLPPPLPAEAVVTTVANGAREEAKERGRGTTIDSTSRNEQMEERIEGGGSGGAKMIIGDSTALDRPTRLRIPLRNSLRFKYIVHRKRGKERNEVGKYTRCWLF